MNNMFTEQKKAKIMIEHISLEEIQEQIRQLKEQEQMIIEREKAKAIAVIKSRVAKYGLSESDIFGRGSKSGGVRKPKMIRYYDPDTGVKWAGRGRKPPQFEKLSPEELDRFRLDTPVPADIF